MLKHWHNSIDDLPVVIKSSLIILMLSNFGSMTAGGFLYLSKPGKGESGFRIRLKIFIANGWQVAKVPIFLAACILFGIFLWAMFAGSVEW